MSENNSNQEVPEYGTEEYARWYRRNVAPLPQQEKPKHTKRNWIVGIVSVLVVGGIISGIAGSGGDDSNSPKKDAAVTHEHTSKPVEKKTQVKPKPVPTEDPATVNYENYAKALDKFSTTNAMPKSRAVAEAESAKYCDALKLDSDLQKTDHLNFKRAFYSDILSVPLNGTSQEQEGEQVGAMVAGYCAEYLSDMHDAANQIGEDVN